MATVVSLPAILGLRDLGHGLGLFSSLRRCRPLPLRGSVLRKCAQDHRTWPRWSSPLLVRLLLHALPGRVAGDNVGNSRIDAPTCEPRLELRGVAFSARLAVFLRRPRGLLLLPGHRLLLSHDAKEQKLANGLAERGGLVCRAAHQQEELPHEDDWSDRWRQLDLRSPGRSFNKRPCKHLNVDEVAVSQGAKHWFSQHCRDERAQGYQTVFFDVEVIRLRKEVGANSYYVCSDRSWRRWQRRTGRGVQQLLQQKLCMFMRLMHGRQGCLSTPTSPKARLARRRNCPRAHAQSPKETQLGWRMQEGPGSDAAAASYRDPLRQNRCSGSC